MKKKFTYSFVACFAVMAIILCGGCFGGKLAWADATYTKVGGISAKVVDGDSKKAFILGADDEARIAKFGELGEISQINILVSGDVSIDELQENTTAMSGERGESHVASGNETVDYYTDWIKVKVKLPGDSAVKIDKMDGNGPTLIDKAASIEDGYYYEKVEYIIGSQDQTKFDVASDLSDGEDNYLYYGFCDENNNVLAEYFIHIQYDIDIE